MAKKKLADGSEVDTPDAPDAPEVEAPDTSDHIEVRKDGQKILVHPAALDEHKKLGWVE